MLFRSRLQALRHPAPRLQALRHPALRHLRPRPLHRRRRALRHPAPRLQALHRRPLLPPPPRLPLLLRLSPPTTRGTAQPRLLPSPPRCSRPAPAADAPPTPASRLGAAAPARSASTPSQTTSRHALTSATPLSTTYTSSASANRCPPLQATAPRSSMPRLRRTLGLPAATRLTTWSASASPRPAMLSWSPPAE